MRYINLLLTLTHIRRRTRITHTDDSQQTSWGGAFQFSISAATLSEWLACWTQAQKGPGSNRSRNAVG